MTLFLKWVGLAFAFFLQTSVFSNLNIFGVVSSFFLAALLYTVSECSMKHSIIFGTVFGVFSDLFFMKVFGINTALYLLLAILASFCASRMRERNLAYHLVITFVFSLVFEYISALLLVGSSMNVTLGYVFLHKVLPASLVNSFWMLLIYGFFRMKKKGWKIK